MKFEGMSEGQEAVLLSKVQVEYQGGMPGFEVKNKVDGKLTITTQKIMFISKKGNFEIDVGKVTRLTGGEFAKRRVKGAIISAVLLAPIALFALIGKKKREVLIVEYSDEKGAVAENAEPSLTGAAILRYKPKGGRAIAIERAIEAVTGLEIEKEAPPEKGR